MDVLMSIRKGGLPKAASLQHFEDYRKNEGTGNLASVNKEGSLVEYETLELRVTPPNVKIDTTSDPESTIVTVDSANRPGTLIELVQHFTMLGLNVRTARVSSDGGWFVDEFRIANNDSTKVTDLAKLESVSRMLNVRALGETEDQPTVSVFEISGLDRPRLFGDLVNLLHSSGCSVRSVAAWTFQSRCAFTIAVADQGAAIADPARQEDLVRHMLHIMTLDCPSAAPADQPTVTCEEARVPVNHERRLHRLMLAASQRAFDPTAPPEEVREEVSDGDGAAEGEGAEEEDEDCVPQDIEPEVTIMEGSSGYWEVLIQCADRPKLMFDAVCTLADMDYEIYHATVDIVESVALLEFYIRPRNTEGAFDDVAARRLEHALKGSIARRFPKGLKIHLHLADVSLMLGDLLTSLGRAGLNITRARVVDDAAGVHALYVMRADGGFPSRRVVEGVCRSVGGTMLPAGVVPPHGWRSKSGSFVGDGPLAAPCSSAGSVGVALSDANAAEAGESTLHGAAFMFQFCGRGKPGHRRDLSGQGSLLQRRRQELDEDLTRAQSSTDLQIYDWSRYVHGSRSNLLEEDVEDNPALDLSGLMGGSSAPDALHLGIAAARASLSNREPSDREPRDAHAHAHGAHPSSSAGSHGSIANENSMATTAVVPAPVLAPMSPRRSLQGLLGSPPVQRPSLFVAPQRPVRLQLVPGGGAAGGQPRTPSRSGDRGKSRLSFNERVKAGNHFGNLGAVAEGSERAEEKQT